MDAVLFDLDGVLTDTASLHYAAWKHTFGDVLSLLAAKGCARQRPFDAGDYRAYVDGRPRSDGVRAFLDSRGVTLPEGDSGDAAGSLTVAGIAARKTRRFLERLRAGGVHAFPDAVTFLAQVRDAGKRVAVVSASRNCSEVLEAAGLNGQFDVQVDGNVAAREALRGKPEPDTFLAAARRLAVEPRHAAVVEDAVTGVQAARAGGFGLVIGLNRNAQRSELARRGADITVSRLTDLLAPSNEDPAP